MNTFSKNPENQIKNGRISDLVIVNELIRHVNSELDWCVMMQSLAIKYQEKQLLEIWEARATQCRDILDYINKIKKDLKGGL